MGDGVLVYFGYPQAHEDDAERAVHSGLDLVAAVGALKTHAPQPSISGPPVTLQSTNESALEVVDLADLKRRELELS
jgi:class 3 adenylate cyclase